MEKVILLRFGELHLKGRNRIYFEKQLKKNIQSAISCHNCKTTPICGRYCVSAYLPEDEDDIVEKLKKVFGIVSLSKATKLKTDKDLIIDYVKKIDLGDKSFRVSVVRADKSFATNSTDFERELGGVLLQSNPTSKVRLKGFDVEVIVDIREDGYSYICFEKLECAGGMPVGTGGKSMLLLSGGIDSPVAGYMIAKRGVSVCGLHFHSYPYTSELAKKKVISLANMLSEYTGGRFKLFVVNFKEVQEEIHKCCKPEYMITIMRRKMMRIAQKLCRRQGCASIVTGENLGQVASQTMEGIISTSEVVDRDLPIFRPLIGFDKIEIMKLAEKIGTYETSILPYEDCCTVFLPKNPLIKPKINLVMAEEERLDMDKLIENALSSMEIVDCHI